MRFIAYRAAGREIFGLELGERVLDLPRAFATTAVDGQFGRLATLDDFIQADGPALDSARRLAQMLPPDDPRSERLYSPLADLQLLAPLRRPRQMLFVGRNYPEHASEAELAVQPYPTTFAKWPSTIIGPGEAILLPARSTKVDFEAELAVVIGRHASRVSVADALDHVAGLTITNDISARDIHLEQRQLTLGKNFRTFAPLGPRLCTLDEFDDASSLGIRLWLNGQLMQDGNTKDMLFGVPEIVSFLSGVTDLYPGDLIATGTPAGVGYFRDPQVFLRPGDMVRIEIEGIGALENPVADDPVRT